MLKRLLYQLYTTTLFDYIIFMVHALPAQAFRHMVPYR